MVPPSSVQIPRVRTYSGSRSLPSHFAYRALTFFGRASHPVLLCFVLLYAVRTPGVFLLPVWPLSRSLAATCEISVDFSSSAYLDVSVRQVPFPKLWIHFGMTRHSPCRVSPFGHPRIEAYLQLPAAFRSLSRPSSAPDAKAFALRSFLLELSFAFCVRVSFRIRVLNSTLRSNCLPFSTEKPAIFF